MILFLRRKAKTELERADESCDADASDAIDYYKGNLLLPVF